ncbi:MAG TPA: SRPBCC family protein [Steroidobacteraceae bacterium]|nr:SRPBCC family protein [Steroidobacteraceae bacterium]
MSPTSDTDRIERSVIVNAPRARVWRAISDAKEFGTWFGVNLEGQTFAAGRLVRGPLTISGYEHVIWEVRMERIEPPDRLAFRWHPYAVDPKRDYSKEEPTLVTFTLTDAPDNATLLTVVESGFDKVPPDRRLEAFRMNGRGWSAQMDNIARHVSG